MTRLESALMTPARTARSKSRRLRAVIAAAWTALILLGCWLPRNRLRSIEGPEGLFRVPQLDKFAHAAMFLGFALFWRAAASARAWPKIVLAGIALIALTETGQRLPFIQRDADLGDALADALGLSLGLILMMLARAPRADLTRHARENHS